MAETTERDDTMPPDSSNASCKAIVTRPKTPGAYSTAHMMTAYSDLTNFEKNRSMYRHDRMTGVLICNLQN
jgi:hypothetical protein